MMKKREINKDAGRNLERYMTEFGLFDWQLALMLGCERKRIVSWRHGRTNIPSTELYKLAKLFDVSVDSFFEGTDEAGKLKRPCLTDYSKGFRDAMYYMSAYESLGGDVVSFIDKNVNSGRKKNDGCRQSMA